jgi:hypothetical protein
MKLSALVLCLSSVAYAEDAPPLCKSADLEVRANVRMPKVTAGHEIDADVTIARRDNTADCTVRDWNCSLDKNWSSTDPSIHVRPAACEKNAIIAHAVGAGFVRQIALATSTAKRDLKQHTFRLVYRTDKVKVESTDQLLELTAPTK